jgi:hypothetical protein
MRRNISTVPDYVAYHAFSIAAGNFTINDAVDNAHNNFYNCANGDNHADIYTIIYGEADLYTIIYGDAVVFGGGNVSFSTGHAGGDASNHKPEHNGYVPVDLVIGLWRQDLQRREDSCIYHHPVCRGGGNILRVSSSPTRNQSLRWVFLARSRGQCALP